MTETLYDLVVVGSAFAGSLLAMIARRLGRRVLLIERGRHPRFAIGESSTPLANLLLEELAHRYDLPRLSPLTKYGSWQRTYPHLACGLKRGFTFYHHVPGQPWVNQPGRTNELLVAASPGNEIADTHWYRPDFDQFFLQEAVALGVTYIDETELTDFIPETEGVRLAGNRRGHRLEFRTRFVVDASGPRGFLFRTLGLPEASWPDYPPTQALFSHFTGVRRWEELHATGGTPYPPDDAALHHVFPGGWMWVLRFNQGITSAGFSLHHDLAEEIRLEEGAAAWSRLLERLPSVAAQFAGAQCVHEFTRLPRMAFRSARIVGERWALLPSAAGFVDPLLSTGFPLTLLGIERLARLLETDGPPAPDGLTEYARETEADLAAAAALVGALHRNLGRPAIFQSLTMLYFAAAIFAEAARRLGKPALAPGFLLRGHARFGPAMADIIRQAQAGEPDIVAIQTAVARAIAPIDVGGLCQPARENWYPVDLAALFAGADKLEATRDELTAMLHRSMYVGM